VPHVTSELWDKSVAQSALDDMPWPAHDPAALAQDTVELAVQINGKVRGRIVVAVGTPEDAIVRSALADERVARELAGRAPRKTVVVPGRLVNVVV
jgi:leucyl-tRNA synthetase